MNANAGCELAFQYRIGEHREIDRYTDRFFKLPIKTSNVRNIRPTSSTPATRMDGYPVQWVAILVATEVRYVTGENDATIDIGRYRYK